MTSFVVPAPAKLNLALALTGRRSDGYHLLDSIVAAVDLFDEVHLAVDHDRGYGAVSMDVDTPFDSIPADSSNLAWQAATRFLESTGAQMGLHLVLRKRIPPGSGMGGASSDAAAVLRGLNHALPHPLDRAALIELAATLGADVPFFLGDSAWARMQGVGEVITALAPQPKTHLVVCWDGRPLSTPQVYARTDLALTSKCSLSNINAFVGGQASVLSLLSNDLEAAARQLRPEVATTKERLVEEGAQVAAMTGSGSAVFGIWPNRSAAVAAAGRLVAKGYWAVAAQTLDHLPSPIVA